MTWSNLCFVLHVVVFLLPTRASEQANWVSEASPTLGCSIEISRDVGLYVGVYVGLSTKIYVCQNVWVELCGPKHTHTQSQFWAVKTDL